MPVLNFVVAGPDPQPPARRHAHLEWTDLRVEPGLSNDNPATFAVDMFAEMHTLYNYVGAQRHREGRVPEITLRDTLAASTRRGEDNRGVGDIPRRRMPMAGPAGWRRKVRYRSLDLPGSGRIRGLGFVLIPPGSFLIESVSVDFRKILC
jgi:hypothetical protein